MLGRLFSRMVGKIVMITLVLGALRGYEAYDAHVKAVDYVAVNAQIARPAETCYLFASSGKTTETSRDMPCPLAETIAKRPEMQRFVLLNRTPARVAYVSPVDHQPHEANYGAAVKRREKAVYKAGEQLIVLASKSAPDGVREP